MSGEPTPCAVCGHGSPKPLFRKFDIQLSACPDCGLVYVDPRVPEEVTLGRYNAEYFEKEYLPSLGITDGSYDLAFFDRRYAYLLGLIAEKKPGGGRLLEIGVGAGFFLKSAARAGWEACGTEVSEACFDYAVREHRLDVRREAAEALSFERDSFDVVVMFDVIEHLFDPALVVRLMNNVLRPGGLLVVGTPNYDALARRMLGVEWAIISPVDHLYYFNETTLDRLLGTGGFGPVSFVRSNSSLGVFETSNPRNTHAPDGLRAKFFSALVKNFGSALMGPVQARGLADNLLCLAYAGQAGPSRGAREPVLETAT